MSKRNRTHLSKLLRELRLDRNLTLEAAAEAIGCHKAFLSGVESGRYPFPLKRLKAADELFRSKKTKVQTSAIFAALLADIACGDAE
jgi:transcriptional regulator with XRE-family HTH domain